MRQIDPSDVVAYVLERADATSDQVEACLAIENEYMAATGILWSPAGEQWPFRYYSEAERLDLAVQERLVDTLVLASDCARIADVPEGVAHAVYAAETEFFVSMAPPWRDEIVPPVAPSAGSDWSVCLTRSEGFLRSEAVRTPNSTG